MRSVPATWCGTPPTAATAASPADRTGLASARNTKPFLLQTYRCDMGGGQFVLLKEAAAPITVNGRHWGGIRLACRF